MLKWAGTNRRPELPFGAVVLLRFNQDPCCQSRRTSRVPTNHGAPWVGPNQQKLRIPLLSLSHTHRTAITLPRILSYSVRQVETPSHIPLHGADHDTRLNRHHHRSSATTTTTADAAEPDDDDSLTAVLPCTYHYAHPTPSLPISARPGTLRFVYQT